LREQRSDPGPREEGSDSFREVPDSLAFGSTSGMTGECFASLVWGRRRWRRAGWRRQDV